MGNLPALPKPGDIVGGKYRVERQLGSGGMGVVFEVTHRVTNKRFAVKWLLPDIAASESALKRFIREAQVAGRFEHPNVVEVYDIGSDAGSYFMVMELLEGESFAERLERLHRLTPQQVCELLVPCMDGVAAAHQAGIIHRDLKPANIFVCAARNGQPELPKVLDFGISKLAPMQGVIDATLTHAGAVMGTPHYMAPEQMRAQTIDQRADVYAFGVILYQALSGERPFNGASFADLVLQVMHEPPKPLRERVPNLPPKLADVVMRAMARDPTARFPDLPGLIEALQPFYRAPSIQPQPLPPNEPAPGSQPTASEQPHTPLFSESIPSMPPIRLGSHRLQWWLAGAFTALLLGAFLAAVFSRPDTSLLVERVEPGAAPSRPAAAQPADPVDPQPATVRIEPEAIDLPRPWIASDLPPSDAGIAPGTSATVFEAATAPVPDRLRAPAPPSKRVSRRANAGTRAPVATPRVRLEMNDFTDEDR